MKNNLMLVENNVWESVTSYALGDPIVLRLTSGLEVSDDLAPTMVPGHQKLQF